jgi:hypothetical protein
LNSRKTRREGTLQDCVARLIGRASAIHDYIFSAWNEGRIVKYCVRREPHGSGDDNGITQQIQWLSNIDHEKVLI